MMKKLALLFVLSLVFLIPNDLLAQKKSSAPASKKGHNIVFTIPDAPDDTVYLVIYYRDKRLIKDTAFKTQSKAGPQFIFKGNDEYQGGLYSLVSQKHTIYMDFVMDGPQFFSFKCGITGSSEEVEVTNSPQNDEMMAFQRKTSAASKRMSELHKAYDEAKQANNEKDMEMLDKDIKDLNAEMEQFIKNLIARNPDYLFSKMQNIFQQIDIPEPPTNPDGKVDSTFQLRYYLTHYWDNIDLSDSRLIFTPILEPKMKEYFNKYLQYQDPDTICKYVDMVVAKTEKDSLMYHFFIDWLSYNYETSKMLGYDGIFVHLVKNNHLQGKCTWMDEDLLRKYEKRVKHLDPILIGKRAPEMVIPDTTLTDDYTKWHSSYRMSKPYVILWFYDPDCPTCKKESQKLRAVYDSLDRIDQRNFDVYAVANDSDIDRWKKYVKEHNYPWINVGGNKGNIDYLEAFNIYESGNPSMFIMNEKHEIILNRRIEMTTIPEFLRQYEKNRKK